MTRDAPDQRPGFFYRTANLRRLLLLLYAACLALLGADLLFHRHAVHPWEALPGFYAVFGLTACVLLVLVAKQMRKLLMRPEDHYDRDG